MFIQALEITGVCLRAFLLLILSIELIKYIYIYSKEVNMKKPMLEHMKRPKFDHFDTPDYAVSPLLPFIKKEWTIWEPTDTTGKSRITAVLRKHGCNVISTGRKKFNFLTGKPDFDFDCIVTNPPYSTKDKFIERCYKLNKPWAMLMPLTVLEGINRGQMFREHGVQLLVLDKRVGFTGESTWFNTSWFCHFLLPEQLMFSSLEKPKTYRTTKLNFRK
jgi:hypothetical protein